MPFPPSKRLAATRSFELPMAGKGPHLHPNACKWNIRSIFQERAVSSQRLSEAFTERYFHPHLKCTLILFRHVKCVTVNGKSFQLISDWNFRIWAEWEAPLVKNKLPRSRKQRRKNKPISMRGNDCILIGLRFSNSDCNPDNLVFITDCKRRNHKKSRKMDKGLISVTTIPSSLSLPTARGKLAS